MRKNTSKNGQEERERKQSEREEREARLNNVVVVKKTPASKSIPMLISKEQPKEEPMPVKAVKPDDPLAPIEALLAATRNVFELQQPEPLRRPFVVAGLRAVSEAIEKTITTMENSND
jgi:hypothetical protein